MPQFSRLRRAYCATRDFFHFQSAAKGILPHKMSAAGDFVHFQSTTNGILSNKMSAAGEIFSLSEHY